MRCLARSLANASLPPPSRPPSRNPPPLLPRPCPQSAPSDGLQPAELDYSRIALSYEGVAWAQVAKVEGSGAAGWPQLLPAAAANQCGCCKLCFAQNVAALADTTVSRSAALPVSFARCMHSGHAGLPRPLGRSPRQRAAPPSPLVRRAPLPSRASAGPTAPGTACAACLGPAAAGSAPSACRARRRRTSSGPPAQVRAGRMTPPHARPRCSCRALARLATDLASRHFAVLIALVTSEWSKRIHVGVHLDCSPSVQPTWFTTTMQSPLNTIPKCIPQNTTPSVHVTSCNHKNGYT